MFDSDYLVKLHVYKSINLMEKQIIRPAVVKENLNGGDHLNPWSTHASTIVHPLTQNLKCD
jgi:hypothetical protein